MQTLTMYPYLSYEHMHINHEINKYFLSDSYITRSQTILLFGPLEFLVIFLSDIFNYQQFTKSIRESPET
jgi:hypothetical protein